MYRQWDDFLADNSPYHRVLRNENTSTKYPASSTHTYLLKVVGSVSCQRGVRVHSAECVLRVPTRGLTDVTLTRAAPP